MKYFYESIEDGFFFEDPKDKSLCNTYEVIELSEEHLKEETWLEIVEAIGTKFSGLLSDFSVEGFKVPMPRREILLIPGCELIVTDHRGDITNTTSIKLFSKDILVGKRISLADGLVEKVGKIVVLCLATLE